MHYMDSAIYVLHKVLTLNGWEHSLKSGLFAEHRNNFLPSAYSADFGYDLSINLNSVSRMGVDYFHVFQ